MKPRGKFACIWMGGLWKACWEIPPLEQQLAGKGALRLERGQHPWTLGPASMRRDRLFLRLLGGLTAKKLCSCWRSNVQNRKNKGKRGPRTGQRIEDQAREQK